MIVIGLDEVGRGPLAGPVCAAAVCLGEAARHSPPSCGFRDSKKLSARQRVMLASWTERHAPGHGLGWASVAEIDRHDILGASLLAMQRAAEACLAMLLAKGLISPVQQTQASAELMMRVDGSVHPAKRLGAMAWPWQTETAVGGDDQHPEIAAAASLAKVARDQHMAELDLAHPGYGLAQHAGYGTAAHLQALARLGPSPVHRTSFAPVARLLASPSST